MRLRAGLAAVALALGIAQPAQAGAPTQSLRPRARPVVVQDVPPLRPRPRPSAGGQAGTGQGATVASARAPVDLPLLATTLPVYRSPRPMPRRAPPPPAAARPEAPLRSASLAAPAPSPAAGPVCGDRAIIGSRLAPIAGKLPGCGVAHPVRIEAVDGVALSRAAVMDCDTARALKRWVARGARPAFARAGERLVGLEVADHYNCRTRNNQPGAKLSEHGKGHAIDIAAFRMASGTVATVARDWRGSRLSRALRRAHKAACGPFGTVLGPAANRYHADHFHFDTARYRSGPYCE